MESLHWKDELGNWPGAVFSKKRASFSCRINPICVAGRVSVVVQAKRTQPFTSGRHPCQTKGRPFWSRVLGVRPNPSGKGTLVVPSAGNGVIQNIVRQSRLFTAPPSRWLQSKDGCLPPNLQAR